MSRIIRGLFLFAFILNTIYLILSTAPVARAQVTIVGPTPTPVSVNGIDVPNPFLGDRTIYPGNVPVNVNAQVGDYTVNISGYSSPNASIVLNDQNGTFLRSTVAGPKGYFTLSSVNIRKGFTGFCLQSIDFKRIGDSEGCLNFAPVTKSQNFRNIYIPPTLGLYQKQINAGSTGLMYGYSMPGSKVAIKSSNGQVFNVTADSDGYYQYRFEKVPAGTYNLSSSGVFQGKKSLEPKTQKSLIALSVGGQIAKTAETTASNVTNTVGKTMLGFFLLLFFLLLIIIGLVILIHRTGTGFIADKFKAHHPLHDDWLLEFEDKVARGKMSLTF